MTGFIEDQLLRFEGLDEKDIADINAALPDIQHLDTVIQAEWPRVARLVPILTRVIGKVLQKQKELR